MTAKPRTRLTLLLLTGALALSAIASPGIAGERLQFAQASKSDLFASDAAPANVGEPRLGGWVEGLLAYNYADPSHWSRAVARFNVSAQGTLGDDIKWKIGGRVDTDAVYAGSDFYLDRVRDDQRFDAFHGETYIDFTREDWTFRIGAQHIVWGEVVGLFFADVVSARDMREFLLPRFDVIRIPQWAARAEYFHGDSHVEFVWIPVPLFDNIGKPGSDFYPVPLPSPTPQEVAELFRDPDHPSRTLRNSNYGVRANTLVAGWDLSAFYYRSYNAQPTFYREAPVAPGQPFLFQPRHDRIWQAGGTVSKDFGEFVLRGEAVYTHGQGFTRTDLTAPESVVKRNTLDYIVAADWSLPHDSRVGVQVFQRVFSGSDDGLFFATESPGVSLFVSSKITSTLEPQLLWMQYVNDGGGLIRPALNWYPSQDLRVTFGVDIFTGPENGFFGRYDNRDRAYVEARWSF